MIECMRNAARKEDMKRMSRDVELKPCPFCGHSIVVRSKQGLESNIYRSGQWR